MTSQSELNAPMSGGNRQNEVGPQLTFNKSYLCMIAPRDTIKEDSGKLFYKILTEFCRSYCQEHWLNNRHLRVEKEHPWRLRPFKEV
jgi:hypothetical protein